MYQSTRKQWGARGHGGSQIGEVPEVVGHTEAGAAMSEHASVAQEEARMRAIDAFHLSLGWSGGFGYSVAVMPSGRLYEGRGYRRAGAHTQGRNSRALAFVVPGHGDRTPMTSAAIASIRRWIGQGIRLEAITSDPKVSGHRDYSNKSCPGNLIYPQLAQIRGVTGPTDAELVPPPPTTDPEPAPSTSSLRRGSTGVRVRDWQRNLLEWNPRALPRFGADGDFGNETVEWTGRFMVEAGMVSERPSNPVVGPRTLARMLEVLAIAALPVPSPPKREPDPEPPTTTPPFRFRHQDVLRHGDKGAAVKEWQQALRRWNGEALAQFGADGDFGDETAMWTARFMQRTKLTSGRPSNPVVGPRTRSHMAQVLNRATAPTTPSFSFRYSATLAKGHTGSSVAEWQQALRRWNPRALPRFGADGDFGNETVEWTSRFMQHVGLIQTRTSNPRVGQRTRQAMERLLNRRAG